MVSSRGIALILIGGWLAGFAVAGPPDDARRRSPVVRVFEECRDAVVNISTTRVQQVRMLGHGSLFDEIFDFRRPFTRERRIDSVGSGFVIHETGLVITNAHVVAQTTDISVTFADGTELPAEIVSVDPSHDLAVLKIDAGRPLPFLHLAQPDDILIGETVIAIGNPLGLQHTVTTGIVSALDRTLHFGRDLTYEGLIQTDAAINPGNSGGPLLNINGDLMGINSAIRGDAQNVGFAIPVKRLWELLPGMLDIERHQRVSFGLNVVGEDTRVRSVNPNGPAAQAGVMPGDEIRKINGQAVRDAIDYYARLRGQRPGAKVRLGLARGAKLLDVSVPIEIVPPPDGGKLARRLLGIELEPLTDRTNRGDRGDVLGLYVTNVRRGSPADRAGIDRGDVLARVARSKVVSLEDVGMALEGAQPGESVFLEGYRVRNNVGYRWQGYVRTQP